MSLIRDMAVGVASLFKGLSVTLVNWVRPKTTVRYPWQRREVFPRYRGLLVLRRDPETGDLRCTACGLCERACPVGAIGIQGEGKGKERRPVAYSVDYGRCMFCRMCVEECPFEALAMTGEHEYAVYSRDGLEQDVEELGSAGRPQGMSGKELRQGMEDEAVAAGKPGDASEQSP
ncbi:MAG: NADH-quinone oxidoreductase subunit I [Armatimonadota bacterium]|nr:MAG: NADH-quinone oxidoreductase subunit I [Armatimonadota bacterium]